MGKVICYNCGQRGHYAKDCPQERRPRGPPIGGRLSNLATTLQDMYQDPGSQQEALVRFEDAVLGAATSMYTSLMDPSDLGPVVGEETDTSKEEAAPAEATRDTEEDSVLQPQPPAEERVSE